MVHLPPSSIEFACSTQRLRMWDTDVCAAFRCGFWILLKMNCNMLMILKKERAANPGGF